VHRLADASFLILAVRHERLVRDEEMLLRCDDIRYQREIVLNFFNPPISPFTKGGSLFFPLCKSGIEGDYKRYLSHIAKNLTRQKADNHWAENSSRRLILQKTQETDSASGFWLPQ
jgi:hypothetical protein